MEDLPFDYECKRAEEVNNRRRNTRRKIPNFEQFRSPAALLTVFPRHAEIVRLLGQRKKPRDASTGPIHSAGGGEGLPFAVISDSTRT
ncbi:hypothetical protein CEXT_750171 [Caerostris extrusa]|uniref:Uncharacterized protein n=1 Tax=Caerostris extrusa TaxID=172846 RepID=A0AAV4NV26_CAEEX|nr:hypothetical protein CEXT_750171 [Caerostris extrusa]